MRHHDVRIALYGLVAGIVLGAGAIAFTQHAAGQASVVAIVPPEVMEHGAPSASDYTKRGISNKNLPKDTGTNSYSTVKEKADQTNSSSSSVAISAPECAAVKAAVWNLQGVFIAVVPKNIKNTEIHQAMDAAFTRAVTDVCGVPSMSSSSAAVTAPSAATTTDNDCEKFPSRSVRRSQCEIAETYGKKYP